MFTHMRKGTTQDRRRAIFAAGLAILREEGLAGFTQPRVAARAGLRQGNLTYYFPTRTDLLVAISRGKLLMRNSPLQWQWGGPRRPGGMPPERSPR